MQSCAVECTKSSGEIETRKTPILAKLLGAPTYPTRIKSAFAVWEERKNINFEANFNSFLHVELLNVWVFSSGGVRKISTNLFCKPTWRFWTFLVVVLVQKKKRQDTTLSETAKSYYFYFEMLRNTESVSMSN